MTQDYTTRTRPDDWINNYGGVKVDEGALKDFVVLPASKVVYTGRQITVSRGHRRSPDGKFREGGNFFSYHVRPQVHTRHARIRAPKGAAMWKYDGPISVPFVPTTLGGFSVPDQDNSFLDPIGAEAIAIVDPSNPNAETGVALGEILKDGRIPIPGIQGWKRRTEIAKVAGSEFLNGVFGWLPLVKDITDTVDSIRGANNIMGNYISASGSDVHREFEFDPVLKESDDIVGEGVAYYGKGNSPAINGSGLNVKVNRHRTSLTRRWFSGTFTYHADAEMSPLQKMLGYGSEADKLFGLALTPDVVWELAPWSWALDWVSNAQQVINNVGAMHLAGLVMRYGFIMEETSIKDTYSMPHANLYGDTGTVPPSTVDYTVKRRRVANPFGFGLDWEGLDPTKLAITIALGINRVF